MIKTPYVVSIVVTFNAEHWIDKCFGSLSKSSIQNHSILAIDNCSSDNTIENIQNRFPNVTIIKNSVNLGFGKANNIGLKWAVDNKADYVFLLNQDAWVEQNTIEQLIIINQSNSEYGIISPVHLNNNRRIDPGFGYYCVNDFRSDFILDAISNTTIQAIYETEFVNAAAWLLSKECIKRNGGFMPIFPHYGEDNNYCKRVINSGLKIGFTPGITIIHDRDVINQKVSFKKKFNRLYVHLLGIFVSENKNQTHYKYILNGILSSFRIFIKEPLVLASLPIALLKILFNNKQIRSQKKDSQRIHYNFIDSL